MLQQWFEYQYNESILIINLFDKQMTLTHFNIGKLSCINNQKKKHKQMKLVTIIIIIIIINSLLALKVRVPEQGSSYT